ncbi:ABC transporter permease [Aquipuribacter sp. MA13-6]|uniref:ABC transporter permease n=1 Tax=unclassified Aquipuribacter TaxID=2635084 RepID=UPI003EF014A5
MSDLPGFLASRYDDLFELFLQHVQLVMVPIVIATVVAVGLALLVESNPIAREVVTTVSATSLTIPSLALFVLLIPLVGLGATAAYIGLTVYAVYPIFVNAVTGLGTVDRNVLESARGMGMSATQRVLRTKLPLAWPVILGGIRTTTTVLTSIAVAAAYVQAGGFGELLFSGISRFGGTNALASVIVGIAGTVVVALVLEAVFSVVQRLTVPRGIRA